MTQPPPATAHPGLFISFEGGDGVGKTTQIRILADLLTAADVDHVLTREPGGTELGLEIRRLLLHGGYVAPRAEALLYAADRAHHIATRVRPALERGAVVLADRYLDSSVAYQGAARSLGPQEVRDLSLWATEGLLPDLTILLDGDPALAEAEPGRFVVIDADRSVDQVADDVIGAAVEAVRRHGVRHERGGAHQGALVDLEAFVEAAARRSAGGPPSLSGERS